MKLRNAVGVATVMVLLAGCGGAPGSASPAPAPSAGRDDQKLAYSRLAGCLRANGQASFPDPVQNAQGDWGFPASAGKPSVPAACEELYRQTRSVNEQLSGGGQATVDIAALRSFAACMRAHGLADWPDPTADGNFELPGRYAPPAGDELVKQPLQGCPQGAGIHIELPRYNNTPKS